MSKTKATPHHAPTPTDAPTDNGGDGAAGEDFSDPIAGEILRLVAARGTGKSICPSEVAKTFAAQQRKPTDPPDLWRRYMAPVRQQAKSLARQGRIAILRRGRPVDPNLPVKGVIRLGPPVAADQDVDPGRAGEDSPPD